MSNDYVKQLGEIGLAIRLKRVSDAMVRDGHNLYKQLGIDFEPNWFALFLLLKERPLMSITEIAEALCFTHPSIHTMVAKIMKKGYLEEVIDQKDKRRRLLQLSTTGYDKLQQLEPVWASGQTGLEKLIAETGEDLMLALEKLENALEQRGFCERTLAEM